jgi:hypothetical protein
MAGHNFDLGHCMCWLEVEKLSCSTWTRRWVFPRQVMEAYYSFLTKNRCSARAGESYHHDAMPSFLCPYQYGLLVVTSQLPEPKKRGGLGYVYVIVQSCHILCKFYSAFWFSEFCHFIVPVDLDQHLPAPCQAHGLAICLEIHLCNWLDFSPPLQVTGNNSVNHEDGSSTFL